MVSLCADRAWIVVIVALVHVAVVTMYTLRHFAMSTNTYTLLSPKLPWRMRETEFYAVFRQAGPPIVVVVDGQTPELADAAVAALTESLRKEHLLFRTVYRPGAGPFWAPTDCFTLRPKTCKGLWPG
jgi:hypothetical protein